MRMPLRRRGLRPVQRKSEYRKVIHAIISILEAYMLMPYSQTDLTELELPETMKTNFPDPNDLLNFTLTITPDEGMW